MTPREQVRSQRLSQGRFQRRFLGVPRGLSRRLRPLALAATLGVLAVTLSGCSWEDALGMGWPRGI
ncbi:MAG: cytochrome C oxidase subunit II, partial [Mycobacterium sp.]